MGRGGLLGEWWGRKREEGGEKELFELVICLVKEDPSMIFARFDFFFFFVFF